MNQPKFTAQILIRKSDMITLKKPSLLCSSLYATKLSGRIEVACQK